jgi:peroxiredoxin family protein
MSRRFRAMTLAVVAAGAAVSAVPSPAAAATGAAASTNRVAVFWQYYGTYNPPKRHCQEAGQDLVFQGEISEYRCVGSTIVPGAWDLQGVPS